MLDALQHGRERYARHVWREAYRSLVSADQATPLDVDDLERLATSAYLTGRDLEFHRYIERLHRTHLDRGDPQRAARCAFWLCLTLLLRGEPAQSNGWLTRGQRLIEGHDCAEQGYFLLPIAEQQLEASKPDTAHDIAFNAAAIGARFGDPDLVAVARHVQGRALIQQWQVGGARPPRRDDARRHRRRAVAVMTGLMYCSVIDACEKVYALSRAREWTFALSNWCEQQPEIRVHGKVPRVPRRNHAVPGGVVRGADRSVPRVRSGAGKSIARRPAAAFYQQGEIHRLRGEFGQAEEAYRSASRCGCEPQPGLALLRLAQGRIDAASAAIRRVVNATADPLQRARFLPAYVEICWRGRSIEARRACAELQELADTLDADALRAMAAQAQGAMELADDHAGAALPPLRRAFELWGRLEAPYDAARVRVLTGMACRALGDEEASGLEFDAARAEFERLGAQPDLAHLDALADDDAPPKAQVLTARELHVLRLIAAGHTNKAIAAQLRLSERTIDRHVSNILGKLDVPSRAAATAYGYDHKLL